MSKNENLIKKFQQNPTSCRYLEIQNILIYFGFEKINAKGSHVKFKHPDLIYDFVIPVHGNECKDFYKKEAKKYINKIAKNNIMI